MTTENIINKKIALENAIDRIRGMLLHDEIIKEYLEKILNYLEVEVAYLEAEVAHLEYDFNYKED